MATAYVAEFDDPPASSENANLLVPIPNHPAIAQQTVTFTTSSQSSAFSNRTRMIRVVADTECRYLVGDNPTAVSGSNYLPANTIEYIAVAKGAKIAFYDGSS